MNWSKLAKKPTRRPTLLGVAPPAEGTPRPSPKGDSGRYRMTGGGPAAIDRVLKKNADRAGNGYDVDAEAIAKVLVRHFGDEAEAVLERTKAFLDSVRRR